MFRRIGLLFITNILVTVVLFTIARTVMSYMGVSFDSYEGLAIWCFILGMGGSFISLQMSKWMAKRTMGLYPTNDPWLKQTVARISRQAGLDEEPELFLFDSPQVNAFATGPSKNNSLVAVSTGLLQNMNQDEAEAVIGHEIAHIANGDMVTMTLVQGIVNSFAMFLSYIVSRIIMNAMRSDDDEGGGMGDYFLYHLIHNIVYMAISFLCLPLIMWVSRWREYRADEASGKLVGKEKMISALEALKRNYPNLEKADKNVEVMAISAKGSYAELFSSHPSLDKRIAALRSS